MAYSLEQLMTGEPTPRPQAGVTVDTEGWWPVTVVETETAQPAGQPDILHPSDDDPFDAADRAQADRVQAARAQAERTATAGPDHRGEAGNDRRGREPGAATQQPVSARREAVSTPPSHHGDVQGTLSKQRGTPLSVTPGESDDDSGLVLAQYVEGGDAPRSSRGTAKGFSGQAPQRGQKGWGRPVRKRQPLAQERNLANRYGPLDVLFAQTNEYQGRTALLAPSFIRDLLVWIIGLIAVAQLLARMWTILPLVLSFGQTQLDVQVLAAISLILGGAVTGVAAIVIIRCLTGMRYTSYWVATVLVLFGLLPWYGFGAPLSPAGIPPLPSGMQLVTNPFFDPSGLFGLLTVASAVTAVLAVILLVGVRVLKKN